jgi:ubiquinone biosynthesis accessory factor UbiJ
MATQSPFSWLESLIGARPSGPESESRSGARSGFTPPDWVIAEVRGRIVLLLNHVLMQEPEATSRLARQNGRVVLINWRFVDLKLIATPAGLLDVADEAATPDLTLALTQESPLDIAMALLKGDKPTVRIEGDVQLAAEVNWLAEHVRWDIEDDLSRIVGDVPARTITQIVRRMREAVEKFAAPSRAPSPDNANP